MSNPMKINFKGRDEYEQAIINTLNAVVDEMYKRRVPQTQKAVEETNKNLDEVNKTHAITYVALAEAGQISEEKIIEHKELFEEWHYKDDNDKPIEYKVGQIRLYGDILYRVREKHTAQADWTPDKTPALYTAINKANAGSIEDPIPAVANMEYTKGLYYIEDGKIYLMNREGMDDGDTITLAYTPSQLVGQYFEEVS